MQLLLFLRRRRRSWLRGLSLGVSRYSLGWRPRTLSAIIEKDVVQVPSNGKAICCSELYAVQDLRPLSVDRRARSLATQELDVFAETEDWPSTLSTRLDRLITNGTCSPWQCLYARNESFPLELDCMIIKTCPSVFASSAAYTVSSYNLILCPDMTAVAVALHEVAARAIRPTRDFCHVLSLHAVQVFLRSFFQPQMVCLIYAACLGPLFHNKAHPPSPAAQCRLLAALSTGPRKILMSCALILS